MADLASRAEIAKLAHELQVAPEALAHLSDRAATELRDLRRTVSDALFARHERRFRRVAALAGVLPGPMTAKIAKVALGPFLAARIASVLDPAEAVGLAKHLDARFLAQLAPHLDPARVAPIVSALPSDLVVEVGIHLLGKDPITLGRFVSVVDVDTALRVVARASGDDLLRVASYAEEMETLDGVVLAVDDATLTGVLEAAVGTGAHDDALALFDALSPEARPRLIAQLGHLTDDQVAGLVAAMAAHDAWGGVLAALRGADEALLRQLVNVPATLDPAVMDSVVTAARREDLADVLVRVMLVLDDDHLAAVGRSGALGDPDVRRWAIESAGVATRLVEAVLDGLTEE